MKQNFKLTKDQQTLVEKNLSIVHWVIVNNIHVNPGICGLEYGDLFQEGCLWLCKACLLYTSPPSKRRPVMSRLQAPAMEMELYTIRYLAGLFPAMYSSPPVTAMGI